MGGEAASAGVVRRRGFHHGDAEDAEKKEAETRNHERDESSRMRRGV